MLKVRNLNKSFGDKVILNDISFDVNKGETVAIIGPSGSGKSTTLRCINLLEKPDSGSLTLVGKTYDYAFTDYRIPSRPHFITTHAEEIILAPH